MLFYSSETWQITQNIVKRIQTFINKYLRRILHLKWSEKVSNTTLWERTKQLPVENERKKRKWRWTHIEETSNTHHTTITYMKPPREEKKRKAEKHLADTEYEKTKRWDTPFFFKPYVSVYGTRQNDSFCITRFRINAKSMCISIYGARLWNSLNESITTCRTIQAF